MKSSENGWNLFWKNENLSFNPVMKLATTAFAEKIEKLFNLTPSTRILDYGSGPGFLADYLATKNIYVTSADINQYNIDQITSNSESLSALITTDVNTNRKILDGLLRERKFDFVILLSVTQYLKDVAELEDLTRMLRSYLRRDGAIIFADVISPDSSSFRDAGSLFIHCARKGKILIFLRFMLYLLFSDYRRHRINQKFLRVSEESVRQIADTLQLQFRKINDLTVHSSRTNYVLTKLD